MELVAQGLGNVGFCAVWRYSGDRGNCQNRVNIRNGGTSPVAGMVHAVVLLLTLLLLMPYAALIPMPAIAAILFMAYNMSGWRTFAEIMKTSPKSDVTVW